MGVPGGGRGVIRSRFVCEWLNVNEYLPALSQHNHQKTKTNEPFVYTDEHANRALNKKTIFFTTFVGNIIPYVKIYKKLILFI